MIARSSASTPPLRRWLTGCGLVLAVAGAGVIRWADTQVPSGTGGPSPASVDGVQRAAASWRDPATKVLHVRAGGLAGGLREANWDLEEPVSKAPGSPPPTDAKQPGSRLGSGLNGVEIGVVRAKPPSTQPPAPEAEAKR